MSFIHYCIMFFWGSYSVWSHFKSREMEQEIKILKEKVKDQELLIQFNKRDIDARIDMFWENLKRRGTDTTPPTTTITMKPKTKK